MLGERRVPAFWLHKNCLLLVPSICLRLSEIHCFIRSVELRLWQTSFNWEEARRIWKNWNIHETPFIRHNLNSAWKNPYMYKEKSTSLPLRTLRISPSTGRLLQDSIFSFFSKCQSRFGLCSRVNREGIQIVLSLTHVHTHTHTHTHTHPFRWCEHQSPLIENFASAF